MADSTKPPLTLFKNRSWSADIHRDKEWEKLKLKQRRRTLHRRSMSVDAASEIDVTDDDIKELRACFELGFGLDPSNDLDPKLKQAFPALELYIAVNRQFNNRDLSRSSSMDSDCSSTSNASSIFVVDPTDDPKMVKMRLKRWAQVVACSVHEACTQPTIELAE
ncbi:hypothetical protein L1987_55199 [Smallanthus sonchifolius]|uniref:Uncharacterized protein n=1 Tax=Smallanthus sonchifolius TaxID=185202 RepID=A0ACB9E9D1_9ASTR|nr:hypothetical protein L1987_55199 [Smallanthus sonchifolius]